MSFSKDTKPANNRSVVSHIATLLAGLVLLIGLGLHLQNATSVALGVVLLGAMHLVGIAVVGGLFHRGAKLILWVFHKHNNASLNHVHRIEHTDME